MKKQPKTHRPLGGLALLGVLAVAVVTAGAVWLRTGWSAIDLKLTDQIADATQLEGFTLSGMLQLGNAANTLHFSLQNGVLQTDLHLDDADRVQYQTEIYTQRTLSVRPQDRDAVNEAARVTQTLGNSVRILKSEATALRRMYTLQLPDGTSLRLAGEDLTLEEPAEVRAEAPVRGPDVTFPLSTYYDYTCSDLMDSDTFPVWTPVNQQLFVLGAGYGVCWQQDFLGRVPGLYRAHGLTGDEINALPADGVRYGEEILCSTTEFGSLEPFYCPADARLALAGVSMADGSTLLLYYNTDEKLCADLVNAAGKRTDHRELTDLPGMVRFDAKLMPRTRSQDAVLLLTPYEGQKEDGSWQGGGEWLAALRVENGTFTRATALELDFAVGSDAAVLNEAGDKVLFAWDNTVYHDVTYGVFGRDGGDIALRVMELDSGRTNYMGHIETGAQRDWGYRIQRRTVLYDTLQLDGGNWK